MKNKKGLIIKKELDTVYIDSSGTKHLDYIKALCAETQIETCRQSKLEQKKRIMKIVELIMRVLENENWGVFYKNQPIQPLELQNGNSLYQVNQVDDDEIEAVIEKALTWQETNQISSQDKKSTTG